MVALEALGNAVDWLQDAEGRSLRQHRLAFLEALDAAWDHPTGAAEAAELRQQAVALLRALDYNKLYPHDILFWERPPGDLRAYLVRDDQAPADFVRLRDFCIDNKFGIGEVHVLFTTYLLLKRLVNGLYDAAHRQLEDSLTQIVELRDPEVRARNRVPFGSECQQRLEAVRAVRVLKSLGLEKPHEPDRKASPDEIGEVAPPRRIREIERYVPRPLRLAYRIIACGRFLEARRASFPKEPWPEEVQEVKRAVRWLLRAHRRLLHTQVLDVVVRNRLLRVTETLLVRAIAPFTPTTGLRIYAYLRSSEDKPKLSHGRMFALLKNSEERLRLLNFLYCHGRRNPILYVERFGSFFPEGTLRFAGDEAGFALRPKAQTDTA